MKETFGYFDLKNQECRPSSDNEAVAQVFVDEKAAFSMDSQGFVRTWNHKQEADLSIFQEIL